VNAVPRFRPNSRRFTKSISPAAIFVGNTCTKSNFGLGFTSDPAGRRPKPDSQLFNGVYFPDSPSPRRIRCLDLQPYHFLKRSAAPLAVFFDVEVVAVSAYYVQSQREYSRANITPCGSQLGIVGYNLHLKSYVSNSRLQNGN